MKGIPNSAALAMTLWFPISCAGWEPDTSASASHTADVPRAEGIPLAVFQVRVVHLWSKEAGLGSAFPVHGDSWLTVRHNLPSDVTRIRLAGSWTTLTNIVRGPSELGDEDWATFTVPEDGPLAHLRQVRIDLDREVLPGTEIYLLGFGWQEGKGPTQNRYPDLPINVVRGKVAAPPRGWEAPKRALFVSTDYEGTPYEGMSGGPAVVIDENTGEAVIVGVYKGLKVFFEETGSERTDVERLHMVIRPLDMQRGYEQWPRSSQE